MCGIFGLSLIPNPSRETVRMAMAKLKILGLYNQTRGRHSCGLYVDDLLMKGVDKEKEFGDFIVSNEVPINITGNYITIGHARHATHGAHNEENAHPHMVENEFILAHNGVIKNIWTMCGKYGVNSKDIHSDSLALAHIINKEGFNVLDEYEGNAALVMTRRSEPNVMYVYRGVSKFSRHEEAKEERPLYYMECEEGIYVSSMDIALLAISDGDEERVMKLEGNVVLGIANGRFNGFRHEVERGDINIGKTFDCRGNGVTHHTNTMRTSGANGVVGGTNSSIGNCFTKKHVPMIWYETLPNRATVDKDVPIIFYHMGRYWIMNPKEQTGEITLAHGGYYINAKGVITDKAKLHSEGIVDIKNLHNHFFYEGLLMKSEAAFNECEKDANIGIPNQNFAFFISKYSLYPVCNSRSDINGRCKDTSEFHATKWYLNEQMLKSFGFTPKWSDRNYIIKEGLLTNIIVQKGNKAEVCVEHEAYQRAIDNVAPYVKLPKETRQESPIVNMYPALVQQNIPFSRPLPKEIREWDVQNFYRTWDSVLQAKNKFSPLELNAILYYVCDVMATDMNTVPDTIFDTNVMVQFSMFIDMCIDSGKSVYEMWDEANYPDIPTYLLIAKSNPGGVYIERSIRESNEEDVQECCHIEEVVENIVTRKRLEDESFHREPSTIEEGWLSHESTLQLDREPPFIDEIVSREQAKVPKDEKLVIEEVAPVQEIEYAFTDAIDYLGNVRQCGVELTRWEDNPFCQEVASVIFQSVDSLMHKLKEVSHNYGETDLSEYVKDEINDKSQV